ncbi:MAG: hypothetical protein JSS75_05180 [Bacteroidetes bacterium]|nr:hypothetical protein [Bacteroidota bacterium]
MRTQLRSNWLLLCIGALLVSFGCNHYDNPTSSTTIPSLHAAGEFGYIRDGVTIDRKNYTLSSSGFAAIYPNRVTGLPNGLSQLMIQFMVSDIVGTNYTSETMMFSIPFDTPKPATFSVGDDEAPLLPQVTLSIDTLNYKSKPGGSIVITEFDTVNNTISGTFTFDMVIETPTQGAPATKHIVGGYFDKIPITVGGYGQGSISATINGQQYVAHDGLTAFKTQVSPSIWIFASNSLGEILQMRISNPSVGTFPFRQSGINISTAAISDLSGAGYTSTSGTLTITSYDTTRRRFSGTFNFIGQTDSTNQTITVTNGKIDNVQWSEM